jgi:hypothetical protein
LRPSWDRLPRDSAALFNPAFLTVLIGRGVQGAVQQEREGLPWEVAYLVVPMCLDAQTRESLPMRINSPVVSWVAKNPEVRSLLPGKLSAMSHLVSEGISFGLTGDVLELDQHILRTGSHRLPKTSTGSTPEVRDIQKTAYFLGRWFAAYPSTQGLYSLFGVRP